MSKLEISLSADVKAFNHHKHNISRITKSRVLVSRKTLLNEYSSCRTYLINTLEARKKELTIVEDFNLVLKQLTKETYWVFNIDNKTAYLALVSERKKQASLYRRKIKSMETRLKGFMFHFKMLEK